MYGGEHALDEKGDVKLGWGIGIGLDWTKMALGVTGGLNLDYEGAIIRDMEESVREQAIEEYGLKGFETKESYKSLTTEQKWAQIQKMKPPFYAKLMESMKNPDVAAALDRNNDGIPEMFIYNLNQHIESMESDAVFEEMMAVPFMPVGVGAGAIVAGVGLATGNPAALAIGLVAGFKFQLGSFKAFIPTPKEEARLLSIASSNNMESKVKDYIEKLKRGEVQPEFIKEGTPGLYYRPGSGLGMGVRVEEMKTNELRYKDLQKDIETINKALAPAEVELKIHQPGNKVELITLHPEDKDIEVHADPLMHDLGIVNDNGRLFLVGNIEDLIITRERFEFPRALASGNSSIRDVICIRQRNSVNGQRSRYWIQQNAGSFLEKSMIQTKFRYEPGLNHETGKSTILNVPGYLEGKTNEGVKYFETRMEGFKHGKTDFDKFITKEKLAKYDSDYEDGMLPALGAVTEQAYQNEKPRPGLREKIANIFKDKTFSNIKETLINPKIISNPKEIMSTLKSNEKALGLENLTDKEMNLAVTTVLNEWFTDLYSYAGAEKRLEKINKKLLDRIKQVKKYTGEIYKSEFKTIKDKNPAIKSSPEEMADRFINDIYANLEAVLEQKPPVDFRTIKVGGLKAGEVLISGTRGKEAGKTLPTLGRTVNFEETPKPEDLELGYGFMEGYLNPETNRFTEFGKTYSLKSANRVEKDLAIALLEIASPIPKDDLELMRSPLAIKILGTPAYRLMVLEKGGRGDKQYEEMIQIAGSKTPEELKANIAKYKDAFDNFKNLINRIRQAQISGKALSIQTDIGTRIEIDMSDTEIQSGPYTKCGNASYKLNEFGTIRIYKQQVEVYGGKETINEVLDVELTRKFVSFSLWGGFTGTQRKKEIPPPTKPHGGEEEVTKEHGRIATRGSGTVPDKKSGGGHLGGKTVPHKKE